VAALLAGRLDAATSEAIARQLTEGRWTHDFPMFAEMAEDLGLAISTDMPEEILELMGLYPQPVRGTGGVEYLPGQRRREHPLPG
jgi:hypothetical protein